MRYSNLRCFPRTWCESSPHLTSSSHLPSTCQWSNLSSEKGRFISTAARQLLHLIRVSIRARTPGARKYNLSYSLPTLLLLLQLSIQSIGRSLSGCSVERRPLPLVAAVQWRIVSRANQHTAHVTIFSLPPSPIISHFQSVFCATGPIRKWASIWIKEDLWLVSLQHRFIERAGGRGEERSTSKRGW